MSLSGVGEAEDITTTTEAAITEEEGVITMAILCKEEVISRCTTNLGVRITRISGRITAIPKAGKTTIQWTSNLFGTHRNKSSQWHRLEKIRSR